MNAKKHSMGRNEYQYLNEHAMKYILKGAFAHKSKDSDALRTLII